MFNPMLDPSNGTFNAIYCKQFSLIILSKSRKLDFIDLSASDVCEISNLWAGKFYNNITKDNLRSINFLNDI